LGEGVGCLDFDHVIRDGVLDPEVAALIASLPPTYVEVSPSGEGLHVWGMIPEAPGRVLTIGGVRVERYSRARYLTVTEVPWRSSVARLADLSDTLQWT
jgi:primase-polymerase (primpol)-like protein